MLDLAVVGFLDGLRSFGLWARGVVLGVLVAGLRGLALGLRIGRRLPGGLLVWWSALALGRTRGGSLRTWLRTGGLSDCDGRRQRQQSDVNERFTEQHVSSPCLDGWAWIDYNPDGNYRSGGVS